MVTPTALAWRFSSSALRRGPSDKTFSSAADALLHAPGPIISRVRDGSVVWTADASEVLMSYARWCALHVADMWACPAVVLQWLHTGDQTLLRDVIEETQSVAITPRWTQYSAAMAAAYSATWDGAPEVAARATAWAAECAMGHDGDHVMRQRDELTKLLLTLAPGDAP